jgi:hypothetical protein
MKESSETRRTHQSLALLHVFLSEEKLPVEIREVNGVQVNEGDVPEANENDIFDCLNRQSRGKIAKILKSSRSSQPIPPAPTSSTLVSGRRSKSSGPKMARACEARLELAEELMSDGRCERSCRRCRSRGGVCCPALEVQIWICFCSTRICHAGRDKDRAWSHSLSTLADHHDPRRGDPRRGDPRHGHPRHGSWLGCGAANHT